MRFTKVSGVFFMRRYRQWRFRILLHEPTSAWGSCTAVRKSPTCYGGSFSLMKPSSPVKLFSFTQQSCVGRWKPACCAQLSTVWTETTSTTAGTNIFGLITNSTERHVNTPVVDMGHQVIGGDVVFCMQRENGTSSDMSSYAKLNRLGRHYKSSESVKGI